MNTEIKMHRLNPRARSAEEIIGWMYLCAGTVIENQPGCRQIWLLWNISTSSQRNEEVNETRLSYNYSYHWKGTPTYLLQYYCSAQGTRLLYKTFSSTLCTLYSASGRPWKSVWVQWVHHWFLDFKWSYDLFSNRFFFVSAIVNIVIEKQPEVADKYGCFENISTPSQRSKQNQTSLQLFIPLKGCTIINPFNGMNSCKVSLVSFTLLHFFGSYTLLPTFAPPNALFSVCGE